MDFLKIAILNVGHGDFIYIETPLGDNMVIDCGKGDIIPSLFLKNIQTINELQITHPHTDHFDDIIGISKKEIKSFRCPNISKFSDDLIGWKKKDINKIKKLRELKTKLKCDNKAVKIGNGFYHEVRYPSNIDYNNPNTASGITILSYNRFKILFGGDLPENGWENLLKSKEFLNSIKETTIFKTPHHGRIDGCCEKLFRKIYPKLCIISDKPLEKDNKNTSATEWYSKRASGCKIVGSNKKRSVLTTRYDNSIFIKVNEQGNFWIYTNTSWK